MDINHPDDAVGEHTASESTQSLTELVEHRHRREKELASLYATARALTALGEVDTVLGSIVRHAHDLIGTDVTYLSVFDDPRSELTLRAVEGSLSPSFRTAHVPANTGVGGRVVETQSAFWVRNYLTDATLVHDPDFDAVLAAEGIVALLGVPLRDGERVFGILYAADRVERPFDIDEVALLSAFADHAAVALQNARLYEESTRALAELQDAYATIERSALIHESLTRVVLTGGGAREVADLLVESLGGRVAIYDRDDHLLVATGNVQGKADSPSDGLRHVLAESRLTGRCITGDTAQNSSKEFHSIVAIVAGDSYLGAVVLSHAQRPSAIERRTLERASQILGLMTLKQNAVVEAEERVRGELLTEVINANRPYAPELLARASSRHMRIDQFNALLVAEGDTVRSLDVTRRLHSLSPDWAGLAGDYLGTATMAFQASDPDAAAAAIQRRLRATMHQPIRVCVAPLSPQDSLGRPFGIATRCLKILRAIGIDDKGVSSTHLGLYATLFDPDRGDDLRVFLDDTLGALIDYDTRRGTDLIGTLASYFENSGNLTRTAKSLHVHMNTLVKRIERVSAVVGSQWQQPDDALALQLAVRLHVLSAEIDHQGH
ncbi:MULTISPECIES: helix-turn-helix domain-containing protein [Rhodococcus]|uniref:helix-turn-helix domain-containing protein n=1 Tax=Rhodococcus globerulus TaxID=33008 RepID=UPI001C568B01|nr:helix-turn-helix domain-containing protein [Rhodococcus globerulus]QXW00464.1 helix-turn-helix domain-containing protein [Rhodococcus globerulus]